ncbi:MULTISPECIES: DUF2490 domain-containing protein [Zobellia]|uniref:Conserved hypothetical lipoprotein n=1 Tax=Zobellia galactanivorans (strain DSM 12802 / CCUG 47099 / CIP 106680 / NCIMB 13871 / Dsij) TaxID=63186 RepID=G0L3P6_ZOBGA|nr:MULTISPECIES: DUF2490 domain-containing protein [Zobellia]MBU3028137.1 DUF2490 domain-containing protein [Zobellia galactanivorans]OWW26446.1 hypothetical protein B4Q04_01815 [Zobellia sp. OII3]CAZ95384.1 Conserved hypothetical lipoprotein [Zobellia galactanivorans]
MTIYYIKKLFVLFSLLLSSLGFCQENLTGYFQPDISLKYKVSTNYSHSFKAAQRAYIYEDDFSYRIRQIDLVHFSSFKIDPKQSLALGVQYRFRHTFDEPEENELRTVQQYKYSHSNKNLNMGSRFRAEQRITPSLTVHRFRYRFAIDFPLKGEELDVGDPYFSASAEPLLSVSKGESPIYDQRLTSHFGWLLDHGTKLEIGAEYRAEDYTQATQHIFFLLTSLIFSL